jgi:hypothetical protein
MREADPRQENRRLRAVLPRPAHRLVERRNSPFEVCQRQAQRFEADPGFHLQGPN